jgi:hypothetical protein
MSATLEMETLMTTLRGATDEQWLAFMKLYNERGVPQFFASVDAKTAAAMTEEADAKAAAVAAPKKAVAKKEVAKKEPKAKKAPAEVAPMPETEDGSAPDASEYRVSEADIDHSVCIGRAKDDDKRWSPIIYRERQCGKKLEEGSDLCKTCHTREEKYAESSSPKIGWMGRVTEEPLDWVHMLGTTWAEEKKPKFSGSGSSSAASVASDAASDSGASEEMEKPEEKKVAAKKTKVPAADKEAKKAAAAAEREAAAAAKKEAAEAKKAAAAAEREAAAAAKKEAAEAKKAEAEAKKSEKAAKPKTAKAEKVADASVPAVTVKAIIEIIGDEFYEAKDGNVYEWDGEANAGLGKRGDYVGRLLGTKGDYSIDSDAAEVL